MTEAGPRTCETIADSLGFEGCKACPFLGREEIKSPLALGFMSPAVARVMKDHVFDVESGQYFELSNRMAFDERSFSNKFRPLTGKKSPHQVVIGHRFTRKVDRTDYLPGVPDLFVTNAEGEQTLNLWRSSHLVPVEGNASIIMDHIAYIIPDEMERKHFLDALAHSIQHPHEKIGHVLLIIGKQGAGKSFFGELLAKVFGAANTFVAEGSDLTSEWTAQMGNRQLVVLEELGLFEKREVYETLKRWVTDPFVTVNEKFVKKYRARTPRLMISFSNHNTPIALSEGDRRFWVYKSPAEPKDHAYYDRLFHEGLNQAPAFVAELLTRDISDFKPAATPPMTGAKAEVLKWSKPVVQQEVEAMIEAQADPFLRDLFTLENLRLKIAERMKNRLPSIREASDALKALGIVPIRQIRLGVANRVRIWAWRNQDHWTDATPAEVRQGLMMPISLEAAE